MDPGKGQEEPWPTRSEVESLSARFLSLMTRAHCSACNGYYGLAFDQPVCPTCHAFLYANVHDAEINLQLMSEERHDADSDSDHDSGNDEPTENVAENGAAAERAKRDLSPGQQQNEPKARDDDNDDNENRALIPAARSESEPRDAVFHPGQHHEEPLHCRHHQNHHDAVRGSNDNRHFGESGSSDLVQKFPPEVLMAIFSFLDDISLFAAANVCKRWYQILTSQTNSDQWKVYTRSRFPLFQPMRKISDWFLTYSDLVESSFCLTCIFQMAEVIPAESVSPPLREKRLGHDLRGLIGDSPEGIKAQPLDSSYYHWQASITGPVGSPYEGGIFYLYLKVPFTYPFHPPEVRFLTRIFHPNISRHGDIGIDSIQQHNWVSGLTIPKVLISIQSLLTDPYTEVCMEPEIGRIYIERRKLFDAIARKWTWKFAMWDVLPSKRRNVE